MNEQQREKLKNKNSKLCERFKHLAKKIRFGIPEYIAHQRNEDVDLEPKASLRKRNSNPPTRRQKLILEITQDLYRTHWGKHLARQGQIHAAAKQRAQRIISAERKSA